jgi:predicted AlkP superfamily phosphohydrolase/phosphomutase
VWVNLRGRDPQGIVGSGQEYQDVCDALVNELRTNWRDPETNEFVVERVLRKEEAYSGDYLFKAPDLIVVYRPGYAASPKAVSLDFDGQSVRASGQTLDGPPSTTFARLIGSGPCLASGLVESGKLVDLLPGLMYLLDRPVPTHVDGNVILAMFAQSYREQTPIRQQDSDDELSDEEEGMIVDRLRDLGYLG